jgi:serine protease Do
LQRLVAATEVGTVAELGVWRDGAAKTLKVKIGNMDQYDAADDQTDSSQDSAPKLGLLVRALTPEEADKRHVEAGVIVERVEGGSPAEEAGIQAGDLVEEFEHAEIQTPKDLFKAAGALKAGSAAVVRVQRGGRSLYLTLQLSSDSKK